MTDKLYGGSFLKDSFEDMPNKNDFKLVSTPIAHHMNNDELSPFEISGLMKDASTPLTTTINDHKEKETIFPSLLEKHPELNITSNDGNFNPVKCARVLFSPTKEIITYRNEYREEESSHLQNRNRQKQEKAVDQPVKERARFLTDPTIPYVLSLYLQLVINVCIISIVFYFGYVFVKTIRADIGYKLEKYTSDALEEISLCSREYYRNKCSTENGQIRVPALERACTTWSKCMNRDPQQLGKSKITAETLADIVNGFIKPISWKSLIFMILFLFGSIIVTNVAFGTYRRSSRLSTNEHQELKTLREKVQIQTELIELSNDTTFRTADLEATPDYTRLQSPRGYSEMKFRPGNPSSYNPANDSYASPLLNRKSSLKQ